MPLGERIEALIYFYDIKAQVARRFFTTRGWGRGGRGITQVLLWIATLHAHLGDYREADTALRRYIEERDGAPFGKDEYEFWIDVLTKGGHDPKKLAEVLAKYKEKYGEQPPPGKTRY